MLYYTSKDVDRMIPSYYEEKFVSFMMGRTHPIINEDYCFYKNDVDQFLLINNLKPRIGREMN
jgi:hypothetical protein